MKGYVTIWYGISVEAEGRTEDEMYDNAKRTIDGMCIQDFCDKIHEDDYLVEVLSEDEEVKE